MLRALLSNHPLANITFAVVILMGLMAYLGMPREQDPEINFNWVNISTALPGASAEDVEAKVTNPLEDALRSIQDVRWVVSSSREGVSNILVRFQDIPPRTFDKRINDLRREIQNKANAELPVEAIDPVILEVTTSNGFPTAMVVLTGQAADEHLRYAARTIKDDLEQITGVDSVLAVGLQEPELLVEFDPAALAARGLDGAVLADGLRGWFRDTFAGKRMTDDGEWLVRVSGTSTDPADLGAFPLAVPGSAARVALDDVAVVRRGTDIPTRLAATDGQPAVLLSVTKASRVNTLELVERLQDYIERRNQVLEGSGLRLVLSDDQTVATRNALGIMQSNALIGLLLVLGVCWLFLGSRIASLVALGVVFSIAGTFWLLQATGSTLNISVLLGVVIVLGMLVDDAVVVVESIYFRLQRGMQAMDAALDALREVGLPVLAAVATTIAAFLPLMLLPGIVGKFMFVIPFVVTIGLLVSLLEAFWMLPAHVAGLGRHALSRSRTQQLRERATHWIRLRYARALTGALRRPAPWLGGAALLLVLSVGAVMAGAAGHGPVRFQFFAFDPIRLVYVNVDMPSTASIQDTIEETMRVEARVRAVLREGEARSVVSVAGLKFTEVEPVFGDRYGQISVSLTPADPDLRDYDGIVAALREAIADYAGPAEVGLMLLSGGPPSGKAISVKVRGDDVEELSRAADAVQAILRGIPGTEDISDDRDAGRDELNLVVDVAAARDAGLAPGAVARLVRLHLDGEVVADLRDRGEKLELRVRARPRDDGRIQALLADPVALPGGGTTTLGALVVAEERRSAALIKHWNLRRTVTVEAELAPDGGTDTVNANRLLVERWEAVRADYPGVELDFSGELDDINESLEAMGGLFALGLGLIYLILAAQFRSYFQPLLILSSVLLAFIGVVLGVVASGQPVSLYTLYGAVALTGISVNAAIVLISAANERRAAGMRTLHATVYAARRRVIAVLMTTGTTIAGLFSLAVGLGGESLLWGPVASAIVWGLGFSSLLTLFVVPVLYRAFMKQRRPAAARG